jgi:hypothetical protein
MLGFDSFFPGFMLSQKQLILPKVKLGPELRRTKYQFAKSVPLK